MSCCHTVYRFRIMENLWNDNEAKAFLSDPLSTRVYTSRLLGRDPALVLHGGGNTSVKAKTTNAFGRTEDILYVKGSGWDLATIEAEGFAPVRLEVLLDMAQLERLSDSDMVKLQRSAMIDPAAPNPSVEAILHAFIPFTFVDHTHADSVVLITNTKRGEDGIREIYGDRVLIVPYVMPGFILAKTVYNMTRNIDWKSLDGMVLMNHGVFTFDDDARTSYDRMIDLVSRAEDYLEKHTQRNRNRIRNGVLDVDAVAIAGLRKAVSDVRGAPMLASIDTTPESVDAASVVAGTERLGPLTPDHVIRTKRLPLIVGDIPEKDVATFVAEYDAYFERNRSGDLRRLDAAPRWGVWPGRGTLVFGRNAKELKILHDIIGHTTDAIATANGLDGWTPLGEKDIFDVEYWELEQAKLKKQGAPAALTGKVAIVTGAASGIGRACVEILHAAGAAVTALDIDKRIEDAFDDEGILPVVCDANDTRAVEAAVKNTVNHFGGVDIVVSGVGIFPESQTIADGSADNWDRALATNLTSHKDLLQICTPYLMHGIDPAVVFIGSKNVPAPGRGAAAYSVSKAGLTQLARVAALELGENGIRVNVVHPNNVFDTALWTDDVLEERAKHYGVSVEEYRKNNLLGVEVSAQDVAAMVLAMVGPAFAKTTGAQVPVDGGNDRVV